MIKKVLFTLSLAALCGVSARAQRVNPCGTDDVYRRQLAAHPEIAERNALLNQEIAEKLSKKDLSAFARTTDDGTTEYHVPIVFHIVHDYGVEFITDAEIEKCVADINKMYNKQNADTSEVIAPFKGFIPNSATRYIGNARITWHLATIDPQGKPTNGVTRRRSYLTKTAGDLAKYDQWPSGNYMNIWVINKMSADHSGAAAYAYKPATGDVIPYYDGVITLWDYVNKDNTISHELGHELNLDHPWGGTNSPKVACGDDEVDDTPITKGHDPEGACFDLPEIYDTACLYSRNQPVGKLRIDTIRRNDSPAYTIAIFSSNSTTKGITFKNRTAGSIDEFSFYPSAPVGSTYRIGLSRNGTLLDEVSVVSTVVDLPQKVVHKFVLPPSDTVADFKLFFTENAGALRDTVSFVPYPRGKNGTVWLRNTNDDGFYNFFYDWRITYGNFLIYDRDSLVDYPDTTNSQNVMDYTYCSKMFTAGQVDRMRAALTSTTANRNNLITMENLEKTGALLPKPALAPKAEFSVERGITSGSPGVPTAETVYFLCQDISTTASPYNFVFLNRSWQAAATSVDWTLSNGATVGATTSTLSRVTTKFAEPGWAKVEAVAKNANGSSSFTDSVYVASGAAKDPIGYWQDFADDEDNKQWPIFNYYHNMYKWEISAHGVYDGRSMRYKSYDVRTFPDNLTGDAAGDYDDFFSPAFDLSNLGANGNLNFMYAGAYATNDFTLMKDVLEIAYSTTCGGIWVNLATMKDGQLQTVGSTPSTAEYIPKYEDWTPKSIDLKAGTANIRGERVFFRFRYKPSSRNIAGTVGKYAAGNNFYIDRINVSNNPLTVNEMILGDKKAVVAPNPTSSNAYVLFQKPNAHVSIQVMDITGKLVYSTDTQVDHVNAKVEIPAAYLGAKGVYMVRISGEGNLLQTEKLIVY